jgi:pimeloyl-ACP methyl ester carboxylesterase
MISDALFNSTMAHAFAASSSTPAQQSPLPIENAGDLDRSPNEHQITIALKTLHQIAFEGTDKQKAEMLSRRHLFVALNRLLASPTFNTSPLAKAMGKDYLQIQGMQIALPQTTAEKMLEIATKIPRIVFTLLLDTLLLPGALVLLLIACCKPNFNPSKKEIKQGKIPILLLHGSGFNQTEWIVGRQFLKKSHYGSVFSLNYDGIVSNDPKKGIENYADGRISEAVKCIKRLTGSREIIIIGHSMGGLTAGHYAEFTAELDDVIVNHVISIATPWQGTPMIDYFWKLGGPFSQRKETKRHQQMSVHGGTHTHPNFRQDLVAQALRSERAGKRRYYTISSSTDYAVPGGSGRLTEDPRRERTFNYLGHYAQVAWPSVWCQIRSWLDPIYPS